MKLFLRTIRSLCLILALTSFAFAQAPSPSEAERISESLGRLNESLQKLSRLKLNSQALADTQICSKAVEWILRHGEFFEPTYSQWAFETLDIGFRRVAELEQGTQSWFPRSGSTVVGYRSQVDNSVQPYAITLPQDYRADEKRRWPLYVVLHGRNAKLNEVSFFHQFESKSPKEVLNWVQLDVFGRTNNAYRWAGEADVFEAIADLKRRVLIDEDRVTLHGFSMGGAGAWHLGLHYPSVWASVGAGAGFVDTVHHLSLEKPLSPLHEKLSKIYDAQEYALNAFNVPIIGYGGELDPQLFAAKTMHARANDLGVSIPLLIGPETAHKFHPDRLNEFMAFLATHNQMGRLPDARANRIRFVTYTLKYNRCRWITIEEQILPYAATTIEAEVDVPNKTYVVQTQNVARIRIANDLADMIKIDGSGPLEIASGEGGRSAHVDLVKKSDGWHRVDLPLSTESRIREEPLCKRPHLQGPIDDAFTEPFICVRPSGQPWSPDLNQWAMWTLDRFQREFDHRLRGQIPIIDDSQVTHEIVESRNLILFGDPGSNSVLSKVAEQLPIVWTKHQINVNGMSYPTDSHSVVLIYPNPLNPRKYVVINSGHTFHESEFEKSNANLYPRLGDIAVIQYSRHSTGRYDETVRFADLFDANWKINPVNVKE